MRPFRARMTIMPERYYEHRAEIIAWCLARRVDFSLQYFEGELAPFIWFSGKTDQQRFARVWENKITRKD